MRGSQFSDYPNILFHISGNIFSCGHGREGRLGLGNEASYVTPQLVKLPHFQKEESVFCVDADISRDHSIFLLSNKSVSLLYYYYYYEYYYYITF